MEWVSLPEADCALVLNHAFHVPESPPKLADAIHALSAPVKPPKFPV